MNERPALLLCICLLLLVGVVSADTLIISPTGNEDGSFTRILANQTYSALRDNTGYSDSATQTSIYLAELRTLPSTQTNKFNYMNYGYFSVNTSSIPDDATITSATFTIVPYTHANSFNSFISFNFTLANFINPADPGTSDDGIFTSTVITDTIQYNAMPLETYVNFTIIPTYINKTSYTSFVSRSNDHYNNYFNGTWASNIEDYLTVYSSEASASQKRPFITVIYTPADITPPDSITSLTNTTATTCSSVNWTWVNPATADYFRLNVYRNGTFWQNLSNSTTFSLWEGLPASTLMTFNSTTEDLAGNRNLTHWQNASVTTPSCVTPTPTTTPVLPSHQYNPLAYIQADGSNNKLNFFNFNQTFIGKTIRIILSGSYEVS